jgi:hypothetical protein
MDYAHTQVGRVPLACVFLAFLNLPAFGQTFGEITGRVTDASSAAVPGATITLISVATNGVRTTVSIKPAVLPADR